MAALLKSGALLKIVNRRTILHFSRYSIWVPAASTSVPSITCGHVTSWSRGLATPADQEKAKGLDRRRIDQQASIVEQVFAEEQKTPTTVVEKVKETTKDATYLVVILAGVAVTGTLIYLLLRELWSSKSPGGVYKNAFKMIKANPQAVEALGEPIKAHGETNRRGRRRHPAHLEFVQDGVNCMRMKFYVEGSLRKGTAHLEVREDETGNYQYRYLYVQLDGQPAQSIVIADSR